METLQAYYNVVFVDSSGFFNLCYYVTKETFTMKGLNNRILLFDIIKSSVSPWSVNEAPPNPNSGEVIIGFLLDPDSPFSNIEMGPLADDQEAAKEFRKFWGDRSELRRFQDGTIREAVVWPAKTYAERRKVHIKADPNHFVINGTEIDCVLSVPETVLSPDFPSYGTGEEAHLAVMKSFNSLSNELPIVTLESSGKWPDDLEAIKMVKAEFHLEIARLVNSQLSLMTVPFVTHTDIFKDGFVFRIEVACHKEIFLLKQVKTSVGTLKIQDNAESRNLELSTEILPKLNSILHGLHQQHNSFGIACRLAKRWISAQLKHGFMLDIAVELLIASLYIHPEPYSCTCSPQVAFIRFLTLFVNHDWTTTPLIVNLNNELTKEDIDEIYTTFTSQRSTLPPMVIPNPLDRRGSLWTKNKPPALILKRIKILAAASLKTLDGILSRAQISDIKAIFRPPLESYDVIIHLKRNEVPTLRCAVDVYTTDKLPVFKPYKYESDELYPIIEYDPVQKYLEELRENFGEFAFFLYDVYGGDFIAVVWKQSAFTPKEFKPSSVSYRKLSENGNLVPDIESILEDFKILGSGIIKKVVKKAENWQIP
ncbi:nucleolar protein 6 [Caerostris extrusa]|uniref:Nucleolar protein 6 n=1 Tax=Caerostris extrusa TaxID=172846 RepID=A0AAV4RNE8_CAEEX|nr:nucleolar protein 6 [Caerostris extrusa]